MTARVRCEERLKRALRAIEQSQADPAAEPKGAPWKVAVPAGMKQNTEASNGWLAERLGVGGRRVSVRMCGGFSSPGSIGAPSLKMLWQGSRHDPFNHLIPSSLISNC